MLPDKFSQVVEAGDINHIDEPQRGQDHWKVWGLTGIRSHQIPPRTDSLDSLGKKKKGLSFAKYSANNHIPKSNYLSLTIRQKTLFQDFFGDVNKTLKVRGAKTLLTQAEATPPRKRPAPRSQKAAGRPVRVRGLCHIRRGAQFRKGLHSCGSGSCVPD